jgi:small subunit ribosomal protein S6
MRVYELTFILNPNLDKDQVTAEIDKLTGQITAGNGKILEIQHLGVRRFSFSMKGSYQGNYYTVYYEGESGLFANLEKTMKLNDNILRYMVVVLKQAEYVSVEAKKAAESESKYRDRDSNDNYSNSDSDNDNKEDNGEGELEN